MQSSATSFRGFVVAVISLSFAMVSQSATAATRTWVGGTGNWADGANWSDGNPPSGANDYGINNDGTAIINSAVPDVNDLLLGWPTGNSNSGHLELQTGGSIQTTTSDGIYVGVRSTSTMSTFTVSGGTWTTLGNGHLVIGDEPGSQGTVFLSSGSMQIAGDMRVGVNGEGNMVIQGSAGSITVGDDLTFHESGGARGRLFVEIDALGISPIKVADDTTLDNQPELDVSLSALAPLNDLVLIDSTGGAASTINLGTNFYRLSDSTELPQGAPISATFGLSTYNWTIDYAYGADSNDIALVFVSVETVPEPGTATLGAFGLLALGCVARRWRRPIGG